MSEATSPYFHTHQLSNGLQIGCARSIAILYNKSRFWQPWDLSVKWICYHNPRLYWLREIAIMLQKRLILIEGSNFFIISPIVPRDRSGHLLEKLEYL